MAAKKLRRFVRAPVLVAALAGGCSDYGCVARGSRVATPRGLRAVEELTIGDAVYSVDVDSGELVPATVVAIRTAERECAALLFADTRLVLTTDHPVFDPEARVYAPAGDWVLGTRTALLRLDDDQLRQSEAQAVERFVGVHRVFDLTVDSVHHNFVADGVVVHNKSPPYPCDSIEQCVCRDGTRSETICEARGHSYEVCDCPNDPPIDLDDAGLDGGRDASADGGRDAGPADGGDAGEADDGGTDADAGS